MSKNIAEVILDQIELNLNVNELLLSFCAFLLCHFQLGWLLLAYLFLCVCVLTDCQQLQDGKKMVE